MDYQAEIAAVSSMPEDGSAFVNYSRVGTSGCNGLSNAFDALDALYWPHSYAVVHETITALPVLLLKILSIRIDFPCKILPQN